MPINSGRFRQRADCEQEQTNWKKNTNRIRRRNPHFFSRNDCLRNLRHICNTHTRKHAQITDGYREISRRHRERRLLTARGRYTAVGFVDLTVHLYGSFNRHLSFVVRKLIRFQECSRKPDAFCAESVLWKTRPNNFSSTDFTELVKTAKNYLTNFPDWNNHQHQMHNIHTGASHNS